MFGPYNMAFYPNTGRASKRIISLRMLKLMKTNIDKDNKTGHGYGATDMPTHMFL